MDKILVTEDEIIKKILIFIEDCDRDDLCSISEEMFGGKICYLTDVEMYEVTPDENYFGAFNKNNGVLSSEN